MSTKEKPYRIMRTCNHVICDGELCIINPIDMESVLRYWITSPLYVPILGGFKRVEKKTPVGRRLVNKVFYFKKDAVQKVRKLKSLEEIQDFLLEYDLQVTIDLFTFAVNIDIEKMLEKKNWWKYTYIEDISNNKEYLPIPVVNTVDTEVPDLKQYIMQSVFAKDQRHPKRTPTCCDCKDNCKDKMKCACFRETLNRYDPDQRTHLGDSNIGYDFKTLPKKRQTLSGIYECNSKCECNSGCWNRVVQFQSKWRFQIFKSEETAAKGWSARTLHDIPAGAFVVNYCGELFEEDRADMISQDCDWRGNGNWKYFVNLQVIQNANASKRIKLSDLSPDSEMDDASSGKSSSAVKKPKKSKKRHYPHLQFGILDVKNTLTIPKSIAISNQLSILQNVPLKGYGKNAFAAYNKSMITKSVNILATCKSILKKNKEQFDSDEAAKKKLEDEERKEIEDAKEKSKTISSFSGPSVKVLRESLQQNKKNNPASSSSSVDSESPTSKGKRPNKKLPNLDDEKLKLHAKVLVYNCKTELANFKIQEAESSAVVGKPKKQKPPPPPPKPISPKKVPEAKIKGKYALRGVETKSYNYDDCAEISLRGLRKGTKREQPTVIVSKDCQVVDGRVFGNIGRFFNHSCDPNMFCQYVFVENQDIRFPVVSFFAARDIKAGEELTWSYNYDDDNDDEEKENTDEQGADPVGLRGVVECLCGADNCRKKLI